MTVQEDIIKVAPPDSSRSKDNLTSLLLVKVMSLTNSLQVSEVRVNCKLWVIKVFSWMIIRSDHTFF